jgi:hypothetical protein
MSTGCPQIQMNFYPNPDVPALTKWQCERVSGEANDFIIIISS